MYVPIVFFHQFFTPKEKYLPDGAVLKKPYNKPRYS